MKRERSHVTSGKQKATGGKTKTKKTRRIGNVAGNIRTVGARRGESGEKITRGAERDERDTLRSEEAKKRRD